MQAVAVVLPTYYHVSMRTTRALITIAMLQLLLALQQSPVNGADGRLLGGLPDEDLHDAPAPEPDAGMQPSAIPCTDYCAVRDEQLNAVCERRIRADAPRSRAVCYARVESLRAECLAACND